MLKQQNELLDLASNSSCAGFRLSYLEVYNWGTFNNKVWRIEPNEYNALITGDIGSGKSTLVDAITTLLVPHNKIIYNRAAGSEAKERSLYSYIRGEYKNEQSDHTQLAKAVSLRDENNYTVLLAYFYNQSLLSGVTLAQVFWLKDSKRNPERFFVVYPFKLNITEHFSHFGDSIAQLKKKLSNLPKLELIDNFKEYSNKFRHLLGIQNEQALGLFYQTISMKSVGNLTEFIRNHMLEQSNVLDLLDKIERNFEDLNQAHEQILKAKKQIELLVPIRNLSEEYSKVVNEIIVLTDCRNALGAYFACHGVKLLTLQYEGLLTDLAQNQQLNTCLTKELEFARSEEKNLALSIDQQGGVRLNELKQHIESYSKELRQAKQKYENYQVLIKQLNLTYNSTSAVFNDNQIKIKQIQSNTENNLVQINEQITDLRIELKQVETVARQISAELSSLRLRSNNIPAKILRIRQEMAQVLNIDESLLPFAGELIEVAPKYLEWEGAIERVLHNLGLSLLVPDKYYTHAAKYVDRTNLNGRIVYYRIKESELTPVIRQPVPNSLASKIIFKPEHEFQLWLLDQIQTRFNYICCDNIEEFKQYSYAMTKHGQIKSGGQRHEKDDRYLINDRSHYILGWDNKNKIKVLEQEQRQLEQKLAKFTDNLIIANKKYEQFNNTRDICRDLAVFNDFAVIDYVNLGLRIDELKAEQQKLTQSSSALKILQEQLQMVENKIIEKDNQLRLNIQQFGELKQKKSTCCENLKQMNAELECVNEEVRLKIFPQLDKKYQQQFKKQITISTLNEYQNVLRNEIQNELDSQDKRQLKLNGDLINKMQVFKNNFPAETLEIDSSIAALSEYLQILVNLETDDLPRHERNFKNKLNQGTINGISLLNSYLSKEEHAIKEKIVTINKSLCEIEYNLGTYIMIVADSTYDRDIKEFREQLRNCLSYTLNVEADNDLYSEHKFLQVKTLIDRFRGRPNLVELDKKWAKKVTDVRNWFNFSASERFIENNLEKEFYSDSSGKSGGQKEKLAYTILGSALVYQFGLEYGIKNSRTFRFVVIDEAFGRGSDESTRYGLELFKRLNLQLVIITPLQKIKIIENYINTVHFVNNKDGNDSSVYNLTIEEYKKRQCADNIST